MSLAFAVGEPDAGSSVSSPGIERLAGEGVIDGRQATAADLQIGATIRVLLPIRDLRPVLDGSVAERIATRFFPTATKGEVPAGAFPAGWVAGR